MRTSSPSPVSASCAGGRRRCDSGKPARPSAMRPPSSETSQSGAGSTPDRERQPTFPRCGKTSYAPRRATTSRSGCPVTSPREPKASKNLYGDVRRQGQGGLAGNVRLTPKIYVLHLLLGSFRMDHSRGCGPGRTSIQIQSRPAGEPQPQLVLVRAAPRTAGRYFLGGPHPDDHPCRPACYRAHDWGIILLCDYGYCAGGHIFGPGSIFAGSAFEASLSGLPAFAPFMLVPQELPGLSDSQPGQPRITPSTSSPCADRACGHLEGGPESTSSVEVS
jgi:hypothetical protein